MKEGNIILLAIVFYLSGLCHQVRTEVILGLSGSLHTHSQAAAECHVVPEVKAAASSWTGTRFPWSFPHEFLVLNIWLVCSELAIAVLQCFYRLHWSCSSLPSLEESKLSGTRNSSVRSSGLLQDDMARTHPDHNAAYLLLSGTAVSHAERVIALLSHRQTLSWVWVLLLSLEYPILPEAAAVTWVFFNWINGWINDPVLVLFFPISCYFLFFPDVCCCYLLYSPCE